MNTKNNTPLFKPKNPRTSKKHRAFIFILERGKNGFTENDILRNCRLASGRNYASLIERTCGIKLNRTRNKNPDGTGTHYRYSLASQKDATALLKMVNSQAIAKGYPTISKQNAEHILAQLPWQ